MSKNALKIDEEYIKYRCAAFREMLSHLDRIALEALDVQADIFNRYMAFTKMRYIIKSNEFCFSQFMMTMEAGHTLSIEPLNNQKASEEGWNEDSIKSSPFFIQ